MHHNVNACTILETSLGLHAQLAVIFGGKCVFIKSKVPYLSGYKTGFCPSIMTSNN